MRGPCHESPRAARLRRWLPWVGIVLFVASCDAATPDAPAREAAAPAAARVEVAQVRSEVLIDRWSFLGEVEALRRANLAAGADGEVREVLVRVGDRVEQGDLLLSVDNALAKARVSAAQASRTETERALAQARRDMERATSLGESILPPAEIEQDETRVSTLEARQKALRAAEREAKASLSRHRVRAPFAGVIAARDVDPGDWVGPGDRALTLVDDRSVEVIVAGSPELIARIEVGDAATMRSLGRELPAKIVGIVRALDPVTRTAKVRLVPDAPSPWLLPGIPVDVEFSIQREPGEGVVVPRDALVYGAVGVRVMKVVDGQAVSVPVEVVATVDAQALVRAENLSSGDTIVTKGNERLRPGQSVTVVEASQTS